MSTQENAVSAGLAGKYMTFKLASEEYGLEILKVRELIGLLEITRVPKTPHFIRGVINLRGKVIPVLDLRLKFGLPPVASNSQTVIIVVQIAGRGNSSTMGVLVDEVLEVRAIAAPDIEPAASLQGQLDAEFILGVGKVEKRVLFLLDIDRILNPQEKRAVGEALAT